MGIKPETTAGLLNQPAKSESGNHGDQRNRQNFKGLAEKYITIKPDQSVDYEKKDPVDDIAAIAV